MSNARRSELIVNWAYAKFGRVIGRVTVRAFSVLEAATDRDGAMANRWCQVCQLP